jgi:hypothetical protein
MNSEQQPPGGAGDELPKSPIDQRPQHSTVPYGRELCCYTTCEVPTPQTIARGRPRRLPSSMSSSFQPRIWPITPKYCQGAPDLFELPDTVRTACTIRTSNQMRSVVSNSPKSLNLFRSLRGTAPRKKPNDQKARQDLSRSHKCLSPRWYPDEDLGFLVPPKHLRCYKPTRHRLQDLLGRLRLGSFCPIVS